MPAVQDLKVKRSSILKDTRTFDPLVSVVVPVFNVKDYLSRCLSSIACQTYPNIEVIIVDDGSTDGSGALCDEWSRANANIKVVHTANAGLSAARNCGLGHAEGDYAVFLDSDDALGRRHVENLVTAVSKTPEPDAAVAVTGFTPCSTGVAPDDPNRDVRSFDLDAAEAICKSVTPGAEFAAHAWGKLYPRSLFSLLHYPVGRYYEDQYVTYKVFLAAGHIVFEDANDYLYTTDRAGSISTASRIRELDYLDAIRETLEFVESECPKAVPAVRRRYLESLIGGVETACLFGAVEKYEGLFEEARGIPAHVVDSAGLDPSSRARYRFLALGADGYRRLFAAKDVVRRLSPGSLMLRIANHRTWQRENSRIAEYYADLRGRAGERCAFLLMTPRYRNYGDHLIAFSERMLLDSAGVDVVIEIPYEDCQALGDAFGTVVRPTDPVFFTGGGYLGDLWPGLEGTAETILESLGSGNKIFFFPESLFYSSIGCERFEVAVKATKSRVTVIAREEASFERLRRSLDQTSVKLLPDVGLFVRRSDLLSVAPDRAEGSALVCLRRDKESLQGAGFGVELTAALDFFGFAISAVDTHDPVGEIEAGDRRRELGSLARRFGEASLVITNRLHGMVLAMIMGTPCVALDNISGKVSGVARWVAASGYPLILCTDGDIMGALRKACALVPYEGNVCDTLSGEKEKLLELIREVGVNE